MARSNALVLSDLRQRRPDLSGYRLGRGQASAYEVLLKTAFHNCEWNKFADILLHAAQEGGAWCVLDLVVA